MIAAIVELVTPASVASSVLFGALIGALYGYEIAPSVKARFPFSLYAIGLGFVVLVMVFMLLQDARILDPQRSVAFGIGRGMLWTITCAAIPAGRGLRGWVHAKRRSS